MVCYPPAIRPMITTIIPDIGCIALPVLYVKITEKRFRLKIFGKAQPHPGGCQASTAGTERIGRNGRKSFTPCRQKKLIYNVFVIHIRTIIISLFCIVLPGTNLYRGVNQSIISTYCEQQIFLVLR